ncbi:MAG: biosynthetic-type acetolactate synthase large subunit [Thermoprotei archaeon]|nr:MAG: biosynthetic-type acetolactate synthase large subunit [Thermoprotei archaeon]
MKLSGAKALVEALKKEKVEVIFGIPGGATLPIHDELRDAVEKGELRYVLGRHEQCVAHMADGYARASGKVGVCTATSGPGATNLVTGIANAYMDSSPIVAITGQVPKFMIGRDAFQEADIIGIATPITKYTFQPRSPSEIPLAVKAAFQIALTGRPGPVLIDVPRDVQTEEDEVEFPEKVEIRGLKAPTKSPHPLQVKRAAELLISAEQPIIIAGGGVILSGASRELIELAELLMVPVVTTLMGKGAIPENHPLCLGMIGMHGRGEANAAITKADVILAVGTRFSDRSVGRFDTFAQRAKIIHVDIDPAEIGKNVRADVPIVADARTALAAIKEAVLSVAAKKAGEESPWFKRVKELKEQFKDKYEADAPGIKPAKLVKLLRKLLPPDAILTTGVGQNQMWAAINFEVYQPRTFITSGGLGTMGFGFPAALGAKVAKPDKVVVDFDGDGSFLMTEQDLATSIAENIPVIVVIVNNSSLGMVRQWQDLMFGKRFMAVDLKWLPDFVKLAEAYGAHGVRVGSYEEFEAAVKEAMKAEVTTVIDVPVSPDEKVFPMVFPGRDLSEVTWG